jgi:hypothetical protein
MFLLMVNIRLQLFSNNSLLFWQVCLRSAHNKSDFYPNLSAQYVPFELTLFRNKNNNYIFRFIENLGTHFARTHFY